MRNQLAAALCAPMLAMALPAQAEVVQSGGDGFVTRNVAVVDATPKEVWLALISPAKWWNSGHTWSGDAANMTLTPKAGGCFCERIPEDPDASRITLEGSAEHMRVIQAYPEHALRMRGGLGPLQSEPANGVLTITMSETKKGTRIVWEYAVGGFMRYPVEVIAPAVDGVMSQQLNGLAQLLGRIDEPRAELAPEIVPEPEAVPDAEAAAPRELSLEEAIDAMANKDN